MSRGDAGRGIDARRNLRYGRSAGTGSEPGGVARGGRGAEDSFRPERGAAPPSGFLRCLERAYAVNRSGAKPAVPLLRAAAVSVPEWTISGAHYVVRARFGADP